jgi:hypothetical protein
LKKLAIVGWPARSTWSSLPFLRTLALPHMPSVGAAPSSLVGNSSTIPNAL